MSGFMQSFLIQFREKFASQRSASASSCVSERTSGREWAKALIHSCTGRNVLPYGRVYLWGFQ